KDKPNNVLSTEENDEIISCCCSERFRNMTPCGIVLTLAEEGVYKGSESTFYRLLKKNNMLHSGIDYVTPEQRHTGRDKAILENRAKTYEVAKSNYPERWSKDCKKWERKESVFLNPNKIKKSKIKVA